MALARAFAAVLLLGSIARAQVGTPVPCEGAVVDRERFRVRNGRVTFHLRFHTDAGSYDAHSVVRLARHGATDAACSDGGAVDRVIDELLRERRQFLDP